MKSKISASSAALAAKFFENQKNLKNYVFVLQICKKNFFILKKTVIKIKLKIKFSKFFFKVPKKDLMVFRF